MYDFNRQVYCKSQGRVGKIIERWYLGAPRRATYIVEFGPGDDFMTNTDDLRSADYCCDGCSEWRSGTPHATDEVRLGDGSVDDTFNFCFLCVREAENFDRDYHG